MTFDFDGARASGYSDSEIIDHVKAKPDLGFDIDAARTSGYSDAEIVDHLKARAPQPTKPAEKPSLLSRAGDAIKSVLPTRDAAMPSTAEMVAGSLSQPSAMEAEGFTVPDADAAPPAEDNQFVKGLKTGGTGAKQMLPAVATIPTIGALKSLGNELGAYDRIDSGEQVRTLGGDFIAQRARMYQNSSPETRAKLRETAVQRVGEHQEVRDALIQSWRAYAEEMKQHQGRTPNFTDIQDVSGFGDWLAFNVGQGVPYMSASALSTLVGGALGGPAGAAVGLGGSGYVMGLGDIQGELIEKGQEDKARLALAGGVPYAALDFLGPVGRTLRNVTGATLKDVASSYFKRLGREVPANLIEEFINEAGQEIVKDAAVTTATGEKMVTDDSLKRWFNAGMAGAAAAGPFAAVSAAPGPSQQTAQPMPGTRAELEAVLNDSRPLDAIRAEQAAQQREREAAAQQQAEATRESMARIAAEQAQVAAVRAQERSARNAQEFGLPAVGSRVTVGDVAGTLAAVHSGENGWDARIVTDSGEIYAFLQEDGYQVVPEAAGDGTREAPVQVEHAAHIEQAAQQVETHPTEAQKEAGNYSKAHVKLHGLDISIENPKGSERSGTGPDGKPWSVQMPAAYGYVKRSEGADGDQVDVYLGDNPQSERVFVVDQIDPATGRFDEHKVMLGFDQPSEAVKTYQAGFSDGSGLRRIGAVTETSVADFKDWLHNADTRKPVAYKERQTDPVTSQEPAAGERQADVKTAEAVTPETPKSRQPKPEYEKTAAEWHRDHIEWLVDRYGYRGKDAVEARSAPVDWQAHQDFLEARLENGGEIPQRILDDYRKHGITPSKEDWPRLAKLLPGDTKVNAEQPLKALEKGQASRLAAHMTKQGFPSKAIPHPSIAGKYAVVEESYQEQRSVQPVAESQAPAPSEPGDGEVATAWTGAAPDGKKKRGRPEPTTLLDVIRRKYGGINSSYAMDLTGEAPFRANQKYRGLFSSTGEGLDELARRLAEQDHFPIDLEAGNDNGGVNQLHELIRRAFAGERIVSVERDEAEQAGELETAQRKEIREKAKELGVKTVARKFEDVERDVLDRLTAIDEEREAQLDGEAALAYETAYNELLAVLRESDDVNAEVDRLRSQYAEQSLRQYLNAAAEMMRQWRDRVVAYRELTPEAREAELDAIFGESHAATAETAEGNEPRGIQAPTGDSRQGAGQTDAGAAGPADGQAYARPGAEDGGPAGEAARPEFGLETQTREDLAESERRQQDAEAQRTREEQEAEARRQADAERGTFALTGSDRPADVLAAQGQTGLFEAQPEQSSKPSKTSGQFAGTVRSLQEAESALVGKPAGTWVLRVEGSGDLLSKERKMYYNVSYSVGDGTWAGGDTQNSEAAAFESARHGAAERFDIQLSPRATTNSSEIGSSSVDEKVSPSETAKEPWQMTRDEYVRGNGFELSPHAKLYGLKESPWQADDVSRATMTHKFQHVQPAIDAGKPVPAEVLADYPDLNLATVKESLTPEKAGQQEEGVVDFHEALFERLRDGTATLDEFKAGFAAVVDGKESITSELSALTKDAILQRFPGLAYRYKNEKKAEVIDAAYRDMIADFALGEGISFTMDFSGKRDRYTEAVRAMVDRATDQTLADYAAKVKAAREERAEQQKAAAAGMDNPVTLDDYKRILAAKAEEIGEGTTFGQARMAMTPEQRQRFDELTAEKSRDERRARADQQKTEVRVAAATTEGQIVETKHTKTGEPLFVVKSAERVERDVYNQWNATAKKMGGWYSSYRAAGAVPGFQFKTRENAEAFLKYLGGDVEQAKEAVQARRDAFTDDRSQTAVERLNEMADRLDAQADETLSVERKQNTARRARMAAGAEASANADKAMAATMRNIAAAIESGEARFLDRVRQKVQIERLQNWLSSARYAERAAKYQTYGEQEKHKNDPPTGETADYAAFPTFTAYRSDLARMARRLLEIDGAKQLGTRLLKVADDVTAEYKKFVKENLYRVSTFKGADGREAVFRTADAAEAAIARSGFKGKATTISFKRGEHLVIMGPEMAKEAGLWQGDDDKRITLATDLAEEIVAKAKGRDIGMPWTFETVAADRTRLKAMGIETPAEFRAALREFIAMREAPKAPDRVKELERKMVGRANDGLDFFPTPAETVQAMIEAAEIEEGMAVLEPSAGWGHIAEQIRVAGVEPDVVEMASDRRELLEAKGFRLVGGDFMDMSPRDFTYGDVFRAPDGRMGVMRGSGGMGSGRVGFLPLDSNGQPQERTKEWVDREDLTGVEKRGSNSGYDRIIMNPPFSDRRDAEHVQHAYSLLRPGGRLVALMGEGVFFGQDKKAQAFREWLEQVGGTSEKLEAGTFLDPSLPANTGVNARMVVVDRVGDSGATRLSRNDRPADDGETKESDKGVALFSRSNLADRIDAVLRGEKTDQPIYLGETPAVLQRLGMKPLPTAMSPENAAKAVFDHGMLSREMKVLADAIADPVAVVESDSVRAPEGALVVITDLVKSDGRPVIVAVHPGMELWRVQTNEVKSVYPKENTDAVTRWLENKLRYVSNEKRPEWQRFTGVQFPKKVPQRSASGHIILTDRDIVKADRQSVWGNDPFSKETGAFSRRDLTGADTKLTTLFTLIADQDGVFKYPKSDATDMAEIAAEVDPTLYVDDQGKSALTDRYHYWTVAMQDGMQAVVQTDEDRKEVWVNAGLLEQGRSRGSALYALVGTWAHNNGYVFIGDPGGVSNTAVYRRTENMISLALKFGTTDFLRPHEDQLQAVDWKRHGEHFYWPGMQWRDGDTEFNLNQMLEASYNAVAHHVPEIRQLRFDTDAGVFVDAGTGTRVADSRFTQLARTQGARRAHAGVAGLKRAVLAQFVLSGELSRPDAWRQALGQLVEQRGAPAASGLEGILYRKSDGRDQGAGALDTRAVEDVVAAIRDGWRNSPRISVVESVADLPFDAPADVEGAYWRGQIWLVAENLTHPARVKFTVFHEGLGHYGLRGFFGNDLDDILQRLWAANPQVRQRAAKWLHANQDVIADQKLSKKDAHYLAIEEALADMAGEGHKITGLKKLVAAVQEWLRSHGFAEVADWLESKTDAEVLRVLADAKAFVEEGRQYAGSAEMAPAYHRAYHGGPQDFEEFSTEHIGSGEGAQAYGWGLYFAGQKEVADFYRKKLSGDGISLSRFTKDGQVLNGREALREYFKPGHLVKGYAGIDEVLEFLEKDGWNWAVKVKSVEDQFGKKPNYYDAQPRWHSTEPSAKEVEKVLSAEGWKRESGRLYEVDLSPREDEYLDWDRPLSEQSESVKEKLTTSPVIEKWATSAWEKNGLRGTPTGSSLYETLTEKLGDQKQASETLRSIGIRGIRYLDGSSRHANVIDKKLDALLSKHNGDADAAVDEFMRSVHEAPGAKAKMRASFLEKIKSRNYNYVVFDDKDVRITAKFSRAAKESAEEASADLKSDDGMPSTPEANNLFGADRPLPKDINLFKRLALHPRMIAAMDADFTPVFQTASDQFERRDEIAAEIQREAQAYFDLPRAGKERVNAVLELGRLQGEVFGRGKEPVVAENTGQAAQLSKPGDTIELTDAEKSGYWGVRRAMDKALNIFRDQFLRENGMPASVKSAADVLALIEDGMSDAAAKKLQQIAAVIREIEQARRTGYVPFTRWGKVGIVVEAVKAGQKETLHFEKVELDSVAGKIERAFLNDKRRLGNVKEVRARLAALEGKYPGADIRLVNLADPKEAATVDMAALDHLAQLAQVDETTWDAVKEQLDKARQAAGFRRHFFGSRNIPGYSTDFERAIADYVVGISGYLARREYSPRWDAAIEGIAPTKPQLIRYANDYRKYANTPTEELSALRQTVFFYYLSGVPATAMVNMTQVPLITAPYLTQFANPVQVTNALSRAYKDGLAMLTTRKGLDIFDPAKAPEDVRAAFQHAWDQGFFVPLQTYEMMGLAQNRSKVMRSLSSKTRTAMEVVSLQFTMAERLNRIVTFIAAYRMATREGFGEHAQQVMRDNALAQSELGNFSPEAFAEWVIDETHYRMGKVNRPAVMRGVGTAILQFKSFTWQTLELYSRLATMHGREGQVALGLMMLALLLVTGLWGLPGAEDLRDLFEGVYKKLTGQDKDVKTAMRAAIAEATGSAKIAELIAHGAPRAIDGMPEISRRLGMGNILPSPNEDVLGVPVDLTVKRLSRAIEYQQRGQTLLASAEMMPNFVKHPMTAWAWSREGVKSAATGRTIIPPEKLETRDLAEKAIGFTPADVAEYREMETAKRRAEHGGDEQRRDWYAKVAATRAEIYRAEQRGDRDAARAAEDKLMAHYREIQRHNEQAKPEDVIRLDPKTVQKKTAEEILGAEARRKQVRKQARGRAQEIEKAYGF